MPQRRIVHYLPSVRWSIGGVVRAVLDLCAVMAARGDACTLITTDATDVPAGWNGAPGKPMLQIIAAPNALGRLGASALAAVQSALRESHVLHLHAPWTPANAQLGRAAERAGKPYLLTLHGMLDDWSMRQRYLKKKLYLMLAGNHLLRNAAAIHCTAAAELEQASRYIDASRGHVIPCLIDTQELRELPGVAPAHDKFPALRKSSHRLLFLSRLHVKKGIEPLFEALHLLRQTNTPAAELFIAGSGDEAYVAQLRARVDRLGLTPHVHFLGQVTGALKLSVYQAADLFVLPTSQENFGLVLPEALGCGTPVVTTRGVDIWQELAQGGATIIDRADPALLAAAIAPLLNDAEKRAELGRLGRAWVFEAMNPDRIVGQYHALYDSLSKPSRR